MLGLVDVCLGVAPMCDHFGLILVNLYVLVLSSRLDTLFRLAILAQMLDIYDANLGLLRIGPFNYEPLRGVDLWLQQTDEFIVQHLSPSPEVEAPNFAMKVSTNCCSRPGILKTVKEEIGFI